jgi:hypothetical protein
VSAKEKKFPPPRAKEAIAPYRKAAPAPPPLLPIELKSAPIVEAPKPHDLLEELEKIEIDPQVLAEERRENRAWGIALMAIGLLLIFFSLALDIAMWSAARGNLRFLSLPGVGAILVALGVRKWRQRGIDY